MLLLSFVVFFSTLNLLKCRRRGLDLVTLYYLIYFFTHVFPILSLALLENSPLAVLFNTNVLREAYSAQWHKNVYLVLLQFEVSHFIFLLTTPTFKTINSLKVSRKALILYRLLFIFVFVLFVIQGSFKSILSQFFELTEYALIYLVVVLLSSEKFLIRQVLPFALLSGFYISTGAVAPIAELVLIAFIYQIIEGRFKFKKVYILLIPFMAFLMQIKFEIRSATWNVDSDIFDQISVLGQTLKVNFFNTDVWKIAIYFALGRGQYLSELYIVVSKYLIYDFEYVKLLLTNSVPRIFWWDKPTIAAGQYFGHHFSIIASTDHTTAINIPVYIGFYLMAKKFLVLPLLLWLLLVREVTKGIYQKSGIFAFALIMLYLNIVHSFDTGYYGIVTYILKSIIFYLVVKTLSQIVQKSGQKII